MRKVARLLITGGAGFIGSNFIHFLNQKKFKGRVVNLDLLTYAGNLENVQSAEKKLDYRFIQGDIRDGGLMGSILHEEKIDTIIHFAAESHVDNSITGPRVFCDTNIMGTYELLNACRIHWCNNAKWVEGVHFHHISTDEVYGSLGETGFFSEKTPYDPSSPYSASKAASDHLVKAFHRTYGLPVTISNCSNNYGPRQNREKLIPLMITNAIAGKKLPVYGDGGNVRDWLYVDDHCDAVWEIIKRGQIGETYNVGGNNEWKNIDIVKEILKNLAKQTGKPESKYLDLIEYVKDRPGHDRRYAIDAGKIQKELNWFPKETFETGIQRTVTYYLNEFSS